jgi:hypothetical protein
VDHQHLNPGQNLVFDPRSCIGLKNLKILNAAKNQVADVMILKIFSPKKWRKNGGFLQKLLLV